MYIYIYISHWATFGASRVLTAKQRLSKNCCQDTRTSSQMQSSLCSKHPHTGLTGGSVPDCSHQIFFSNICCTCLWPSAGASREAVLLLSSSWVASWEVPPGPEWKGLTLVLLGSVSSSCSPGPASWVLSLVGPSLQADSKQHISSR